MRCPTGTWKYKTERQMRAVPGCQPQASAQHKVNQLLAGGMRIMGEHWPKVGLRRDRKVSSNS